MFLKEGYSYLWFSKVGLKVAFSVFFLCFGYTHIASRGAAIVLCVYYVVTFFCWLCTDAMVAFYHQTSFMQVYQAFYRAWRIVLASQLVIMLFKIESEEVPFLGWTVLPTLLFAIIGLITIAILVSVHGVKISRSKNPRAKITPQRINFGKSSPMANESINTSKDSLFNLSPPNPTFSNRNSAFQDLLNGLPLYIFWSLCFITTILIDSTLQKIINMTAESLWIRSNSAILAVMSLAILCLGKTFRRHAQ